MTKSVLVTGAASGIGQAQMRAFCAAGYEVFAVDKAVIYDQQDNLTTLQLDVTSDLETLFREVVDVDIICNTAGILDGYKPLLEQTMEEMEQLFAINLYAPAQIMRHYLPNMLLRQDGIIINMCSIASFLAGGGGASYTASKHALAGLTKQVALDYADKGIQVFGIAPGAVKTGMTASDFEPGGLADWVAQETPIKRWSLPEEIAELTLFLASGKASSMQGEIVKIDGGWSLK